MPEAIAYRRRMGFRDEEVRCAVVICEMVKARAAGVPFRATWRTAAATWS